MELDRRAFLRIGSIGTAMAATGLGSAWAADTPPVAFRTLGRTGLKITVIGFGTMKTSEPAVFQAAFDRGVNYLDTARVYMDGRNEAIVGQALKGYRDRVYVATKIKPGTKAQMFQRIDESLAALQVDYVDVLQLHDIRSAEQVNNPEYREVFAEARKQGKTRFIGVTTHSREDEVINAVVDDPDKFWDMVLVTYNFKKRPEIKAAIARAAQANLGVIAMKTQMGGYNTKELGDVSPHQAALKWVLQDPSVTAAVPGMVDLQQVIENTAVMGMKLSRADVEILERYEQAIAPYYCHRCGACQETCPARVEIPDINRSLMYAEGYRDVALARSTYAEIPAQASLEACGECSKCVARCAYGLDIEERMGRAKALLT